MNFHISHFWMNWGQCILSGHWGSEIIIPFFTFTYPPQEPSSWGKRIVYRHATVGDCHRKWSNGKQSPTVAFDNRSPTGLEDRITNL